MDSWSFNSVGKGFANFASNESPSTFGKSELGSTTMGWEVKPTFIFGNNNMGLLQNEITVENQVFGDMGFPPLMKNSSFNSSYSQENEFNPATGSKSKESGKFDLKLGRVIDQNGSKISHNLSPSKRPREKDLGSTTPFCKVHGCSKDLSDCKDYHKRHKVCEAHSRTSKVIVNGIEQRFCQQCSRFHLLREFDDEKRSCRKRLAGHNERRRKPHGRLLPSYNIGAQGNEIKGSVGAIPSFLVSNVPLGPYHHKYDNNMRWETNLEDQTTHDLQSISTITTEQFHPKSFSPSHFKTNHRILNGCMGASTSSSESALSLLSSQTWGTTQDQYVHLHQQHDMNPIFGFEGSLVNLGIDHEISRGSKRVNCDDRVFQDDGSTIDLLQLSSRLERVEHQKQRSQVNLANDVSVGLSIT